MFFTVVQWWKCLAADNLSILNIYLHWKWPVPAPGLWEFDLIKAYLQHRKRKKFVVEYFLPNYYFLLLQVPLKHLNIELRLRFLANGQIAKSSFAKDVN